MKECPFTHCKGEALFITLKKKKRRETYSFLTYELYDKNRIIIKEKRIKTYKHTLLFVFKMEYCLLLM